MDQLIFASLSHTHYWYEESTGGQVDTNGNNAPEDLERLVQCTSTEQPRAYGIVACVVCVRVYLLNCT